LGPSLEAGAIAVRARIARAVLGEAARAERVGAFVLRPAQCEGLRLIREAIAAFGGALLADRPGTGKTVLALAVARTYGRVLVAAPATLREQWTRSAIRAAVPIEFVALEALSRSRRPPSADLVIVDEAHQVRTPTTVRHRVLAEACMRAEVLLLTATPVVNRRADRDALLSLFLGARAARLSAAELARVIVRRRAEPGLRPSVVRAPRLCGAPDVLGLGAALRALPAPLPLAGGSTALALIRVTLALAWCSSLAALDGALRRRLRRGEMLRDTLRSGRWPTREMLRDWTRGDGDVQLAFAELLAPSADVRRDLAGARDVVETHLVAVRALRARIGPHLRADTLARAAAIRALCEARPRERVVVFARHADTIRALARALRPMPGVVMIHGHRVEAAAGRWQRAEVLDALGRGAGPVRHDDARAIRLLLTTDLLAEGVELPGVRTIVHGDLAWTPSRLEQRRGRLTRACDDAHGAAARVRPEVQEARFALPREAVPFLRLLERLRRKRRRVRDAVRSPAARDALRAAVADWRTDSGEDRSGAVAAAVEAPSRGFIAVVRDHGRDVADGPSTLLYAGTFIEGRWRVTSSIAALARLARSGSGPALPMQSAERREIRRALARAHRRRTTRALACAHGNEAPAPEDGERASANAHRSGRGLSTRLAARLGAILRRAPLVEQGRIGLVCDTAREALRRGIGAGIERRMASMLRETIPDAEFLEEVELLLRGRSSGAEAPAPRSNAEAGAARLAALLILTPTRPLPPEAPARGRRGASP